MAEDLGSCECKDAVTSMSTDSRGEEESELAGGGRLPPSKMGNSSGGK